MGQKWSKTLRKLTGRTHTGHHTALIQKGMEGNYFVTFAICVLVKYITSRKVVPLLAIRELTKERDTKNVSFVIVFSQRNTMLSNTYAGVTLTGRITGGVMVGINMFLEDNVILVLPTVLGHPPKINRKEILSADHDTCTLCLSAVASMSGCCQKQVDMKSNISDNSINKEEPVEYAKEKFGSVGDIKWRLRVVACHTRLDMGSFLMNSAN